MFRYEDEVFGDSEPELDEGEVNFQDRTVPSVLLRTWKVWNLQKFASVLTVKPPFLLFVPLFFVIKERDVYYVKICKNQM